MTHPRIYSRIGDALRKTPPQRLSHCSKFFLNGLLALSLFLSFSLTAAAFPVLESERFGPYSPQQQELFAFVSTGWAPQAIMGTSDPNNPITITDVQFGNPSSCTSFDGFINVTASGIQGIQISLNGGGEFFTLEDFDNLPIGEYNIVLRYADLTCVTPYDGNPVRLSLGGSCSDTLNISTTQNTITPQYCLDGADLPAGATLDFGYCNFPLSGGAPSAGTCFQYQPGPDFLGPDFLCVFVCDRSTPVKLCDTTYVAVNVLPPVNGVFLNIPAVDTTNFCLTSTELQIPGPFVSGALCSPMPTGLQVTVTNECIVLDPIDTFQGGNVDFCVVVCNDVGVCDSTNFNITVADPCFDTFAGGDTLQVVSQGFLTEVCLPYPFVFNNTFDLLVDDNLIVNQEPCNENTVLAYSYARLLGQGNAGPYRILAWTKDMQVLSSGPAATISDLVDSLNVLDPAGNWMLNADDFSILGGDLTAAYGDLVILHIPSNISNTSMVNTRTEAFGTDVDFTVPGVYEVVSVDPITLCSDTMYVEILPFPCQPFLTNGSGVTELVNGEAPYCLGIPFANIGDFVVTLNSDTLTTNLGPCNNGLGTLVDAGPVGTNTFAVYDRQNCVDEEDVEVVPFGQNPNIIRLTTFVNTTFTDICFDDSALPGGSTDLGYCQLPVNGGAPSTSDVCVNYIPNPNFLGMDTFCVVICNPDTPAVCDTTSVIMTVVPRPDTLDLTAPGILPFDTCIAATGLVTIGGAIESFGLCDPSSPNVTLVVDGDCVTVDFADTYNGGSILTCVYHCGPIYCDTTYLNLSIDNPCPDIFTVSSIDSIPEGTDYDACLPIDPITLRDGFTVRVNGTVVVPPFEGCDSIDILQYNLTLINQQSGGNPFNLNGWLVNGQQFTGRFASVQVLADSIASWDPAGNWTFDSMTNLLRGGNALMPAGNIDVSAGDPPISILVSPITIGRPTGSVVTINNGTGTNVILITNDADGCSDELTVNFGDPNLVIDLNTEVNTPTDTFCLDTTTLMGPLVSVDSCDDPQNGTFTAVGNNCYVYTPDSSFVGTDMGCFVICDATDCDTTLVNITVTTPCPDLFPVTDFDLTIDDCDELVTWCSGLNRSTFSRLQVAVNGTAYNDTIIDCAFDSSFFYTYRDVPGAFGGDIYEVQFDLDGTVLVDSVTTLQELVDLLSAWAPNSTWTINSMNQLIFVEPFQLGYGGLTITNIATGDDITINPGSIITTTAVGINLANGQNDLVITDPSNGCEYNLSVNVTCTSDPCEEIFTNDFVGLGLTDCDVDTVGSVCLPIGLQELGNYDIFIDDVLYTGSVTSCNFDSIYFFNYESFPGAGLAGPYEITRFVINGDVFMGTFNSTAGLIDLLNQWDQLGTWTYNPATNEVIGGSSLNVYGEISATQTSVGAVTTFGINSLFLPQGTAIDVPIGTRTLVFIDPITNCADTLLATVNCVNTTALVDTVNVGASDTVCVSTEDLSGMFFTLEVGCESPLNFNAEYVVVNDTCIAYTGLTPGNDQVCLVLCDDLGVCDTTFFDLTVLSDLDPPVAVDDTVTTTLGFPIVVNEMANDQIDQFDSLYIVRGPNFGAVTIFPDGTINYVPNPDYCDDLEPDSFEYAICNPAGCDTATVFVFVLCPNLDIFNGFSPNGDGVNDVFVIRGISLFPNNILRVYNRWGNIVYETEGYLNDWDGTWEGKDLPDGTYFYLFDDGESEEPFKGYLQIHR